MAEEDRGRPPAALELSVSGCNRTSCCFRGAAAAVIGPTRTTRQREKRRASLHFHVVSVSQNEEFGLGLSVVSY